MVGLTVAVVGGLVLAGLLGWNLHTRGTGTGDPTRSMAARTAAAGVIDGSGPVTVQVWVDLDCADCRRLVMAVDAALGRLVAEERITRVYHPVPTRADSLPAAASIACAAEVGAHPPYLSALLSRPAPPEGAAPTGDELVHLAGTTGLIDPAFARCVRSGRHLGWARQVAARAAADRVGNLPVVRVDHAKVAVTTDNVDLSAAAVLSAIEAAAAG